VTLRGTVGGFREKREATSAAKRVYGVTKVDNELSVRLLDGDGRDDADLRGAVLQALMLDSLVPSTIDATVTPGRDRVDGPPWGRSTLVVFGAHGTPSPRPLGRVLAAEAAAAQGRFWALTSDLLSSRHDDPADLEAAMVRAGLDAARTLVAMRAGTVADRILADTASALASGVVHAPALFIDGEQYRGELVPAEVSAAWDMTR